MDKLVSSTNKLSEAKKKKGGVQIRDTPTKCTVWALCEPGPKQTREIRTLAEEGTTLRDYY